MNNIDYLKIIILNIFILLSLIFNLNDELWDNQENIYYQLFFILIFSLFIFFTFKDKIKFNNIDFVIIALLLLVFFTRFYKLQSFNDINILITFALIFYYVGLCKVRLRKNVIVRYYKLLTLVGCVLCFYSLFEYYYLIDSISFNWRITGNFSNPAPLGGFIAMIFPLSLFTAFKKLENNSLTKKTIWIIVISLQVYVVILSNSRTAIICLLLSLVIFSIFFFKKEYLKHILIIFLCLFFTSLFLKEFNSVNGRFLIWKITLYSFFKNPFIGIGYNFFNVEYINFQADYFENNSLEKEILLAGSSKYAFNEFLKFFIENGILGFSFLILTLYYLIKFETKFLKIDDSSIIYIAFFSTFIVFSCFSYPLKFLPFKLILLNQISFIKLKRTYELENKVKIYISFVLPVFLMLTIGFYKFKGIIYWKNGYQIKNKKPNKAKQFYDLAIKRIPNNGQFLFSFAHLLEEDKPKKSLKYYSKALSTYNNPIIYSKMAIIYEDLGFYNEAEKALIKRHYIKPSLFIPQEELLDFYTRRNNETRVHYFINKIIKTPIKVDSKEVKRIKEKAKKQKLTLQDSTGCTKSFILLH